MGALLAVVASLGWGTADVLGGVKARDVPILTILFTSEVVAVACSLSWALLSGSGFLDFHQALAGFIGGAFGIAGVGTLLGAMKRHKFGLVGPISGLGVLLPVAFGLSRGESPGSLALLGAGLAIVGTVTVVWAPGSASGARERMGLLLALASAVGFGGSYIGIGLASKGQSPAWAVFCATTGSLLAVALFAAARRQSLSPRSSDLPFLGLIGACTTTAVFAYSWATHLGDISIASVLGSLSPAVIVILAALFLHERLRRHQVGGVLLLVAGVAAISAHF